MDDANLTFELSFESGEPAGHLADVVNRVAEESCQADDSGVDETDSFVMITTEVQAGHVVKRVVFDHHAAAERFRSLLPLVEPTIAVRGR